MSSAKKETPQDKYHKAHTVSVAIRLMKNTEQDIICKLNSSPNKARYIKNLIRADISSGQENSLKKLPWVKVSPNTMPLDMQRVIITVEYSDGNKEVLANCRWNQSIKRWEWEIDAGAGVWDDLEGTVTHWMSTPEPADD